MKLRRLVFRSISIGRVNEFPALEGVRVEKMQTVETLNEGLKRAYTLTITAKDIDARVEKEVKTLAPQVRMPGFRPGKVPANLESKMHGQALQLDALNGYIQAGVQKLRADTKLR